MLFQQLFDQTSSTYTYVLARRPEAEALIIDPVYEHVETYLELFRRLDLRLVKAIDTHTHADHVTGMGQLRDETRCITVMGENSNAEVVSMRVEEGETVDIDGVSMDVLFTPGHTDDSYSFALDDRVFTGDALLIGGTGRTDFQNGDAHAAYDSLFNKLLKLPDRTLVYPAHDYNGNTATTIGTEKAINPRLQVDSPEEYAEIMANLDLGDPSMMDVAVPANESVGSEIDERLPAEAQLDPSDLVDNGATDEFLLFDLREDKERNRDGLIPGSIHVPYTELESNLQEGTYLHEKLADTPNDVVFYCAFGERSALALEAAQEKGFEGAKHLRGGVAAWLRAGGEVA